MALNIQFTNFATGSLNAGISAGATSLTLQAGQGALFPTLTGLQYFYVVITDAATHLVKEIAKATARTADVLTITRAQEGTTALAWLAGDIVELRPTAASLNDLAAQSSPVFLTANAVSNTYIFNGAL